MSLSHEDMQAILKVLDDSPYDELQLENKDFSLYLKRSAEGDWVQQNKTLEESTLLETSPALENTVQTPVAEEGAETATEAGLIEIRSPMVGTFYSAPQPGAEPFVKVGDVVSENSVIAIIEVMKLMNSIPARIAGVITEVLAEDAQFVEKGQLLMRVSPAKP